MNTVPFIDTKIAALLTSHPGTFFNRTHHWFLELFKQLHNYEEHEHYSIDNLHFSPDSCWLFVTWAHDDRPTDRKVAVYCNTDEGIVLTQYLTTTVEIGRMSQYGVLASVAPSNEYVAVGSELAEVEGELDPIGFSIFKWNELEKIWQDVGVFISNKDAIYDDPNNYYKLKIDYRDDGCQVEHLPRQMN